jgi:hypothetical protein
VTTSPSIEQWRDLYEAARLFREQAPWDVLTEDMLFAVETPGSGETLYCSVLGASDGQSGLIATRGARGLLGYIMLTGDELDEDERPTEQDGLSFLLGNGQLLNDADREVQAQLALKFEDDSAWPLFRSLRPHRVAAAPDAAEAAALTVAIEQANALAKSIRDGAAIPEVAADELLGRQQDAEGVWQTTVLGMPAPPPEIRLEADPVRCAVVLRRGRRSREVWEATMMTLGVVDSDDGSESFWARLLLCVDSESKQVVGGEVLGPDVSPQHALIAAIEKGGTIPRTLDVTSGLLESQLKPLADVLKIRMRRVQQLANADALREQMRASVAQS